MPALQARDFPDDLYEQLKIYAASQHRSIAQQTIVAVEEMLQREGGSKFYSPVDCHPCLDFDTEVDRAARIKKRKELFVEISEIEWKGSKPTSDEIVTMVREGHEERDHRILEACESQGGSEQTKAVSL